MPLILAFFSSSQSRDLLCIPIFAFLSQMFLSPALVPDSLPYITILKLYVQYQWDIKHSPGDLYEVTHPFSVTA
jgi:hypothetical protein